MIKQKHILYFVLIVVAAIALLLYNPWLLYFQNDDMVHIPLSRDGILLQHNSFRPICDLSMMLDYRLYGKQACGYHLTNLTLHIVNSVLVFITAKLFIKKYLPETDINLFAFTVGVLFWIYMNHDESVFWILGRSAMLGMLFFLPALHFYFCRKTGINFLFCILFCFLSWLSYESTLILPAIFFIISFSDIQEKKSKWKIELKFLFVLAVAFIVYCCCRFYFMGLGSNYYNTGSEKNITIPFIIGSFIRLAIRSWLPPSGKEFLLTTGFVILTVIITFWIIKIKSIKKRIIILMLLLLWVISLLPYLALSIDTKGVEGGRFLYLPSFFICMIISVLVLQLTSLSKTVMLLFICVTNIWILFLHSKQYSFAGSVVKTTIKAVNSLKNKNTIYALNVPQENFGALIFRSGFTEGINWLKNKRTADTVVQLSTSDKDLPLHKNYPVKYSNDLSLVNNINYKTYFTGSDVYFLYTDSCLIVIAPK